MGAARVRLDVVLSERGLFESRSRAAAAVIAGEVMLGAGRQRAAKPGQLIDPETEISVKVGLPYVSRGGVKLANALDKCALDVRGRSALDVGASTGGFTDCLLQRGAERVIALDVAYGELSYKLRADPRVFVIERCNARSLSAGALPFVPDLIVIDVSFISLTKVLEAVLAVAAARFDCLAMIKPQFEVGRERIGKGGVVREAQARREALTRVGEAALSFGAAIAGYASSGLPGPKGNRESFVWLTEGGRAGVLAESELATAVAEVEPDEVGVATSKVETVTGGGPA